MNMKFSPIMRTANITHSEGKPRGVATFSCTLARLQLCLPPSWLKAWRRFQMESFCLQNEEENQEALTPDNNTSFNRCFCSRYLEFSLQGAQSEPIKWKMALFPKVSAILLSQRILYRGPGIETHKCNAVIFNLSITPLRFLPKHAKITGVKNVCCLRWKENGFLIVQ